ncbi:type IV pilus twitching motility protein PilT [Campylobacter mucosalis]|uniref:type IV pilus twitching motility protein PilT n=1 Tax=Campylobacter mucosalis TaxID=202 RepID=UPI00146FDBF4|nr:type IV pilus twitching motility protein PilT [Campylobacter mucosalis]
MDKVAKIRSLLETAVLQKASDLHLVADTKPQVRICGVLSTIKDEILDADEIKNICYSLLNDTQIRELESHKELDFAFSLDGVGRFRANYYHTIDSKLAAVFRVISESIPALSDIDAPSVLKEIINKQKGLVLVTGATGSGKSTSIAAMLNEINLTQKKHIITIEDPVEFIHKSQNSLFSQRNVGTDTLSYARALKHALREDPDIIFIGELRDAETISIAVSAAETGHLVFATLHTNSAIQTISRIVDSFDGGEQTQVRSMLASSLSAVISQVLMPRVDGGRVAIYEVLLNTPAISNLIRENKLAQIYSQMQISQAQTNMQTQSQALIKALRQRQITKEVALQYSNNQQELLNLITGV